MSAIEVTSEAGTAPSGRREPSSACRAPTAGIVN